MCNARDNVPLSGKFYRGRLYSHLQGEIQNYFSEDGASNGYIFQRCWMFLQVIPCSWFSKKKKKKKVPLYLLWFLSLLGVGNEQSKGNKEQIW